VRNINFSQRHFIFYLQMNFYNSKDLMAFHEATLLSQTFNQASNDMAKTIIGMNQFFSELNKAREAIDSHNSFISNLNASLVREVRDISENYISNLNANLINIKPFSQPSVPFSTEEVAKFQFSELRFKYPKSDTSIPNVNQETQISSHDFPEISHPIKIRKINWVIHLKFDE
jgi:hypothetical protein